MNKYLLFIVLFFPLACSTEKEKPQLVYKKISGITMGVVPYHITYSDVNNLKFTDKIDSLLAVFNQSLSTYVSDSEISQLNTLHMLKYETEFMYPVLKASNEVYKITSGAFDPTVGPLVNLWGFGPDKKIIIPDSSKIKEILSTVGFSKVDFSQTEAKTEQGVYLDFSAIAKGYAVDLVGEFLQSKGVNDYFVEIGGELSCIGLNPERKMWRTGIYDPTIEEGPSRKVAAIANVDNRSLATSGNYRNFYIKEGKKYAHTISPFTGYPVQHSILSASVFAENCMLADAYATAFMVLGVEKSIQIVTANQSLEAHLIYADENGNLLTYTSEGIKDAIILE